MRVMLFLILASPAYSQIMMEGIRIEVSEEKAETTWRNVMDGIRLYSPSPIDAVTPIAITTKIPNAYRPYGLKAYRWDRPDRKTVIDISNMGGVHKSWAPVLAVVYEYVRYYALHGKTPEGVDLNICTSRGLQAVFPNENWSIGTGCDNYRSYIGKSSNPTKALKKALKRAKKAGAISYMVYTTQFGWGTSVTLLGYHCKPGSSE